MRFTSGVRRGAKTDAHAEPHAAPPEQQGLHDTRDGNRDRAKKCGGARVRRRRYDGDEGCKG